MKATIINRRGLITWFNKFNHTEHPASRYTGVSVGYNQQDGSPYLRFRHNNGEGKYVIPFSFGEWSEGDTQIRKFVTVA